MLVERARRHYEQRGYSVASAPAGARAELLVEKGGRRRLVRVADDPLGTYQIGSLAAEAKRARLQATVICPAAPEVIDACEQFGVEHLTPEGLGEEMPVLSRRAAAEPQAAKVIAQTAPVVTAPLAAKRGLPWRWIVVGVIWLLAVVAWAFFLTRVF